jgi:hypothetical protein
MLKLASHNSKLNALADYVGVPRTHVLSLDLPAGWTCAKAGICKTFVCRKTGKMKKVGPVTCYAAKAECYAPSVRRFRWNNFDVLFSCRNSIKAMIEIISDAIPSRVEILRIHSSGDIFSPAYYQALVETANNHPHISFFGYTKHLFYATLLHPDNFKLQYSYGSKDDSQWTPGCAPTCFIGQEGGVYPTDKIVCSKEGSEHEDYYAILAGIDFIIPVH